MPNRISEISPVQPIYFAGTDEILLTTFNSLVDQTVRLMGKFLDPDGNVVPIEFTWSPPADRSQHLASFTPGEGFLQSLEILPDLDTKRGQLWVRAAHRRVSNGVLLFETTLAQGYVSTDIPLSWPGWNIEHSISGRGVIRFIFGTDPPPGSMVYEVVPTNVRWRVIAVLIDVQTSAASGDRYVQLAFTNPDDLSIWEMTSPFSIGPSSFKRYMWSMYAASPFQDGHRSYHAPLPAELFLMDGMLIRIWLWNAAPGDDFYPPRLFVEEWIEP